MNAIFKNLLTLSVGSLALGVSGIASAEHETYYEKHEYHEYESCDRDPRGDYYRNNYDRYEPDPVEVVEVHHYYHRPAPKPRKVYRQARPAPRYNYPTQAGYESGTPMVLGGIIGGVLGHQVGKGKGKDAATLAGIILGGSIGREIGHGERF